MVESVFAFDEIMITKVTISLLTIGADIVTMLTIAAIGALDERFGAGLLCLMWRTSL
jgi:MFS-type transporter involved in bile tolerance (Atg22 family)